MAEIALMLLFCLLKLLQFKNYCQCWLILISFSINQVKNSRFCTFVFSFEGANVWLALLAFHLMTVTFVIFIWDALNLAWARSMKNVEQSLRCLMPNKNLLKHPKTTERERCVGLTVDRFGLLPSYSLLFIGVFVFYLVTVFALRNPPKSHLSCVCIHPSFHAFPKTKAVCVMFTGMG